MRFLKSKSIDYLDNHGREILGVGYLQQVDVHARPYAQGYTSYVALDR